MVGFSIGMLCGSLLGFMLACIFAANRIKDLECRIGDQDNRLDVLNELLRKYGI